jgi:hypothetical protein
MSLALLPLEGAVAKVAKYLSAGYFSTSPTQYSLLLKFVLRHRQLPILLELVNFSSGWLHGAAAGTFAV